MTNAHINVGGSLYCVSKKTPPTFLAVTQEIMSDFHNIWQTKKVSNQ